MKKSTLQIIYKKVGDLIALDKNPRKISDDDFERLRQSVEKLPTYFEARPLLVNDASGQLIVYAGNQRLKAAKKLGLKEIPCIVETLSQQEQDERMIRDNIANGEWDFDILSDSWSDLDLEGMGLELPELLETPAEPTNLTGSKDEKPFQITISFNNDREMNKCADAIRKIVNDFDGANMKLNGGLL